MEAGLAALPLGVEFCWMPSVAPFIHRELIAPAVEALVFLGRRDEAHRVLDAAEERYPGQPYLEARRKLLRVT